MLVVPSRWPNPPGKGRANSAQIVSEFPRAYPSWVLLNSGCMLQDAAVEIRRRVAGTQISTWQQV